MKNTQSTTWLELYRAAIAESDPEKLRVRILQAHRAIQERGRQLWYERLPETGERTRLDAAHHSLEILRKLERMEVGDEKGGQRIFSAAA